MTTAIADAKGTDPTFDAFGRTWTVVRKPDLLLLSELARTDSGDPAALGVLAEFFEVTLGREVYGEFKRAFRASDEAGDDEALPRCLAHVIEVSVGRPTE